MFVEKDRRLVPACEWPGGENVFNMERAEFPPVFSPNGAFYITAREDLRASGELVAMDSCEFFVMDVDDSIDIDTELDMVIAETVLRRRDGVEKTK